MLFSNILILISKFKNKQSYIIINKHLIIKNKKQNKKIIIK